MFLKQLELFLDVARYTNFTRAAEINYMTQPAVTKQIRNLESELGFLLFKRDTHTVELTAAGRYMFSQMPAALARVSNIIDRAGKISQNITGEIRIAYISDMSIQKFIDIIGDFTKEYPDIQIHFFNRAGVLDDPIREDYYDLIFGEDHILKKLKREFLEMNSVDYYYIFRSEDAILVPDAFSLKKLNGRTVIMPSYFRYFKDNILLRHIKAAFPHSDLEFAPSLDDLLLSISENESFSILPNYYFHGNEHYSRVKAELPFTVTFGTSINRNNSDPSLQKYLEFLSLKRESVFP